MSKIDDLLRGFGRRLRALRQARGWSQEELGRRTRRHWTYIGGLERGERNPTITVISDLAAGLGVSPTDLLDDPHPLVGKIGASAHDILSAIEGGFRALVDVKGKLAELLMNRQLDALKRRGQLSGYEWHDADGVPDFAVTYRGQRLVLECKNVRNEMYRNPAAYKVELQKTRNSLAGRGTRGYRVEEFDVLGVALFNQVGRWDYLYVAVRRLERRPDAPDVLKVMQRVPLWPGAAPWTAEPLVAFDDALELRK